MSEKKLCFPSIALLLRPGTTAQSLSGDLAHTYAHKGTITKSLDFLGHLVTNPAYVFIPSRLNVYISTIHLSIIPNTLTRSAATAVLSIACRDTNTLPCGAVTYWPRHCPSLVTDTWYTALGQSHWCDTKQPESRTDFDSLLIQVWKMV